MLKNYLNVDTDEILILCRLCVAYLEKRELKEHNEDSEFLNRLLKKIPDKIKENLIY